jgi:hypothetical protein
MNIFMASRNNQSGKLDNRCRGSRFVRWLVEAVHILLACLSIELPNGLNCLLHAQPTSNFPHLRNQGLLNINYGST